MLPMHSFIHFIKSSNIIESAILPPVCDFIKKYVAIAKRLNNNTVPYLNEYFVIKEKVLYNL